MRLWLIPFCVLTLAGCGSRTEDAELRPTHDWLLLAPDDTSRFEKIQTQFRGFDQPMWETGERYERLHNALERNNFDLAAYHWRKIKTTIENGIAKRPGRAPNAQSLFLIPVWESVNADIESKDPKRAWDAFIRAKAACVACHKAEEVEYVNDQPLFDLTAPSI